MSKAESQNATQHNQASAQDQEAVPISLSELSLSVRRRLFIKQERWDKLMAPINAAAKRSPDISQRKHGNVGIILLKNTAIYAATKYHAVTRDEIKGSLDRACSTASLKRRSPLPRSVLGVEVKEFDDGSSAILSLALDDTDSRIKSEHDYFRSRIAENWGPLPKPARALNSLVLAYSVDAAVLHAVSEEVDQNAPSFLILEPPTVHDPLAAKR